MSNPQLDDKSKVSCEIAPDVQEENVLLLNHCYLLNMNEQAGLDRLTNGNYAEKKLACMRYHNRDMLFRL